MKFIVYVSQSTRPCSNEELARLLEGSRVRNTEDSITGLLIYRYNSDFGRGNFIQVLEGPEDAIEDVWRRISNDGRHHTVVLVEEGEIERRMFGRWSMGFKNVDASDLMEFEGFSEIGSDEFWQSVEPEALSEALDLLKSFVADLPLSGV